MADNNIDPELIRELSEKYESMRDAMASMIPAMVLSTTAINQMIAASKGLSVSEKEGKDVVDAFIDSIKQSTAQAEKKAKADEDNNKKWKNLEATLNNTGNVLKAFGTSLISTTNSMAKYQSTVNAGAKGITDLVGSFLPEKASITMKLMFKGFTAVIDVLSFFVGNVFKQNDAMIKSYDSLSEVGATSALTTNDIRKLGQNAGYTSENLDKFTDITKGLGSNLVALGGSASKGVVEFSKLATVTQAQRDGYNNLGISQEQYTKLQATYIRQTTSAGMVITKSTEQQRKEADKYIDSLVELAALTGISVQKQQEALDIANADENFNQYKASRGMKRQALLEQAENEQDQNRKKQLVAQADAIQKTIEQKDAYAKVAVNTMSAANAAAVLQSISTDGATVYTEANAKLLMAGIDVAKHNREMNAGRSQEVELLEGQVKATRRFSKMFGNAASAFGESSKELQKEFGVDNKMRETAAQFDKLKTEEGKKQFLEQRKLNKQEIDAKKAGLGPADAAKEAQNAQLATELAFRKGLDELTAVISGPVTGGFTLLMKATMALGKTFANLSHMFGGPDVRHLFKTPEELKKDIDDLTADAKKLESALAKEVSLREDKLKADEAYNKKDKELQEAKQKAIDLGKNRPDLKGKSEEEKTKEIEKWQKARFDQDALVKKLEEEKTKLSTETYRLKREIEKRGIGSGTTAEAERLKSELEAKRKEIENAKKRAAEAGAAIAPPATATGGTTAPAKPAKAEQATPQQLEKRAAASASLGKDKQGNAINTEDVLGKIRFKNKEENTGGGKADPKLIDMAQKINDLFPGSTITALNDVYHQKRRDRGGNIIKSRHTEGKALDFSLNPPPENADAAAIIKEQLKDLGASKVLDEYFADNNSNSTAGHFHVEVMKDGGIIQSQPGGTLVQAAEAGMNEAFVPLPKGRNIPVSMPSLDKLTASNKALAEDLRLLVGGNATNNPLVDALSTKLTEKLDPEKLLLNLLSKNIPGVSKAMNMNAVAGVAGADEMSTTEKLLEVAKLLNPTVRLVSKLFDTYQAISGNEQKQISKLYEAIAPTSIIDQKPIDKKLDQAEITDKKQLDVSITLDKTIEQTSAIPKIAEKPIDQPVVPAQKTTEKPIEAPVTPIPKLTDKTPDFTNIGNGFDKNSYRMAVIDLADIFKTKSNTEMPDVNGLVKSQLEQQQNSQQDLITKLSTAIAPTVAPPPTSDTTAEIVELLSNKLDTVINKLDTGNNLQEDFNKQSMI